MNSVLDMLNSQYVIMCKKSCNWSLESEWLDADSATVVVSSDYLLWHTGPLIQWRKNREPYLLALQLGCHAPPWLPSEHKQDRDLLHCALLPCRPRCVPRWPRLAVGRGTGTAGIHAAQSILLTPLSGTQSPGHTQAQRWPNCRLGVWAAPHQRVRAALPVTGRLLQIYYHCCSVATKYQACWGDSSGIKGLL